MNRGRQFFRGGAGNPDLPRRRRFPGQHQFNEQPEQRPLRDGGRDSGRDGGRDSGRDGVRDNGRDVYDRKIDELTRGHKTDIDEIRNLFAKLTTELDQVKLRVKELESSAQQLQQTGPLKEGGDWDQEKDKRRKLKLLKQREKRAAKNAAISESASHQERHQKILNPEQATTSNSDKIQDSTTTTNQNVESHGDQQPKYDRRTNRERRDRVRREFKPLPKVNRTATINDDSTTQAAEPSSEDRPEGDDGREGANKERVKVLRRKKPHFTRRNYNNRRRRADSSERNSNDTSPQNEANGNDDYQHKRKGKRRTYVELSESELNEVVQTLKREFVNLERPLKDIRNTMNEKGPKVVYGFAVSILDHALCDVTSPTKLSEIAKNLYQLLVSEDNTSEIHFQQGFYNALNDISKREDDIAIDAPRYMDTLGQVLADCIIPMVTKHKYLIKRFLNKCVDSYCKHNRAVLLASIMKGIAGLKNDRFAKEIWDIAQLNWESLLEEGSNLSEFLESHEVKFTTQAFSPEPRKPKKVSKELEKFADDVTSLVEKKCTSQTLEDLVKDLNLESTERIDYLGTLIYAIVRGCLTTDSGDYKLNNEALNQYSSILNAKHDQQDAIALYSLTALTKLWHQYNCPQDLLRTIFAALHNQGTASFEALNEWLNSESLTNIPGIGAARLSSKRYIEDLGANLKS